MKGVVTALEKTHRTDIILAAAGNSKTGMDFVRSGKVHVITYQSAESAGALPVDVAVNWFNGIESQPVTNLPIRLITQDVGKFILRNFRNTCNVPLIIERTFVLFFYARDSLPYFMFGFHRTCQHSSFLS